jgi:hypothetical protein
LNPCLPRKSRVAAGAGSALGFAVGVIAAASLQSSPAPGQVPGHAAVHGFDPHTDVLRLVLLAVAPLVGGFVAMQLASKARSRRGAATAGGAAHSDARDGGGAGLALQLSAVAAHAITVWTFLVVPLTLIGLPPIVSLAALAVVSFALARILGRGDPVRGAYCLAAACPILPLTLLGERSPTLWLAVGLVGIGLPILARAAERSTPGIARLLRTLLVWVLLPGSVTGFVAAAVGRAPMLADVFEDGHHLLPASEYLKGELPYRDIVPGHGLLSDGLLQAAQLTLFGDDYRGLKRGTKVISMSFLPAFYALGWAATASPAVGFGGLVLTLLLVPNFVFVRAILSIGTLTLAVYGARTRKAGAWLACGASLPLALCAAVDFTAYAAAGVAVALWVARGKRVLHLRNLLVGAGISAGAIGLTLAGFGILGGFLRTTFVDVPSLLPVYALGFPPVEFYKNPGLAGWLRNQTALAYAFLAIAAVVSGALLPRAPRVGPRARALLPVLAWIGCAMLSVIERHHVVYPLLAVPVCLLLLHRWARGWSRWTSAGSVASGLLLAALLWSRGPVSFLSGVAGAIVHPWIPPGARAVDGLERARGAVFDPRDAALIDATARMIREANLRSGDTWLDFANAPGLYYLFDRDCPVRYYEVPFYESESAQREVIATVAANPRVRTVLMFSGLLAQDIDHISNSERAPLVAAFLREHFRPFSNHGGIEFWIRKDRGPATSGP